MTNPAAPLPSLPWPALLLLLLARASTEPARVYGAFLGDLVRAIRDEIEDRRRSAMSGRCLHCGTELGGRDPLCDPCRHALPGHQANAELGNERRGDWRRGTPPAAAQPGTKALRRA